MNVLIIGGNGFIGSHLVDRCIKEGDSVKVVDLYPERFRSPIPQVDYINASVLDLEIIEKTLKNIDVVYYLANSSLPNNAKAGLIADVEKDLIPFISFLTLLTKFECTKLVYYSSGGAIYGPSDNCNSISENHNTAPISPYGILKLSMEQYIRYFVDKSSINALIIRPSNPYGIRQGHLLTQGVISTFLYKALKEEELIIWGDGTNRKDYLRVEDLVQITRNLVVNNCVGIYNIGSGKGTSLLEIIEAIKIITKKKITVNFIEGKKTDVKNFVLNIDKILQDQDIAPEVSLYSGIEGIWTWMNKIFK